ncbi:MAG: phosphoribosylanthranilate isomerase [Polaribacter sp.]
MKYLDNIRLVAALQPDYLGFIFYEKSKRNFEGVIPKLPKSIKKTGVFVDEHLEIVVSLVEEYQLDAVQLHGDESVEYIVKLKEYLRQVQIIKVFGIKDEFNFDILKPYLDVVDYFLFDTKGKERGGNGVQFDWSVLKKYPYKKPYFLSGGIGLEDVDSVLSFLRKRESKYCYAIDVNSKFESEAGLKKIKELKKFKKDLTGFKNL